MKVEIRIEIGKFKNSVWLVYYDDKWVFSSWMQEVRKCSEMTKDFTVGDIKR